MENLFEKSSDPAPEREELLNKWKDKTPQEVLEAKINADLHIKAVEKHNAELRQMYLEAKDELTAKAKWDDYLDQLKSPKETLVATTPANEVKPMDMSEIEKFVSSKIQETENKKHETENFNRVQSKLKEKLGDNYASLLEDQRSALGLSVDEINALAKKSPEAFFRVLGINDTAPKNDYMTPPRSNQRSDNFSPKVNKRDERYYQELKKTNPRLYLDPKIQVQMEKDATDMGMSFFAD